MKAIIVDDSMVIRNIIAKSVKSMGYEVVQAGDGKKALELLEQLAGEVQLILLDWNMPVMNGYETIMSIKKNKAYKDICIVMVSTESEDDKVGQALAAGAHGYLAKPFTEEEFVAAVSKALSACR